MSRRIPKKLKGKMIKLENPILFSRWIRSQMAKKDILFYDELAKMSGISNATIHRLIHGYKKRYRIRTIKRIVDILAEFPSQSCTLTYRDNYLRFALVSHNYE